MKNFNSVYIVILAVCILFFACKNDASSSSSGTDSIDTTMHKVIIDQAGGTGLTQTVYPVKHGKPLEPSELQGASTIAHMLITSYTADDTSNFILGTTPVMRDMKITAHWGFDPSLNCDVDRPNAKTKLLTYLIPAALSTDGVAVVDTLGIACALQADTNKEAMTVYNSTPFMEAAKYTPLDALKLLYVNGVNIHAKDRDDWTALFYAARSDHLENVQYLVEVAGLSVTDKSTDGSTPLLISAKSGMLATSQYLVAHGANALDKTNDNKTALILSASNSVSDQIAYFVGLGIDVNALDNSKMSALMYAAKFGNPDAVKYLFEHGATVTSKNSDGMTALLLAATNYNVVATKSYSVLTYLLDTAKANIADVDNNGMTALMWAVEANTLAAVQFLAKYPGIALDATATGGTYSGKTALGIAQTKNYTTISTYLSTNGAH